jgi:hypothetical protein
LAGLDVRLAVTFHVSAIGYRAIMRLRLLLL